MILSCIIDTEEKRDLAVIYIPNAFIQTRFEDENEIVVIKIIGAQVDLLLELDTEFYGTSVTTDKKGEKVIIVQCMNAIYGVTVDILLYYKEFVKTLNMTGFQLNPYGPYVTNTLVNDIQQTIYFYVNNSNISHQDRKVNDEFINTLRDEYESKFEDGSG